MFQCRFNDGRRCKNLLSKLIRNNCVVRFKRIQRFDDRRRIDNRFRERLWVKFRDKLGDKFWNKLWNKFWDKLSYSHRREHAEAIASAKRPETRARRVESALAMLLGKAR